MGTRVTIPASEQAAVLTELHEGHLSMAKMKSLAPMYVRWTGIGDDIEKTVRQCTDCQLHQSIPAVAPLNLWSWLTRSLARLHLGFASTLKGKMYEFNHSRYLFYMDQN